MASGLAWGNDALTVELEWSADNAPRIAAVSAGPTRLTMAGSIPLVEALTVCHGHLFANDRLVHTLVGHEARYLRHRETAGDGSRTLELVACHQPTGLELTSRLTVFDGIAAVRSDVVATNRGRGPVALRSLPSLATCLGGEVRDWDVHHGRSDWLGEGRWVDEPLGVRFPLLDERPAARPRGEFSVASTGTWSTGKRLPVGGASSDRLGAGWAWQIEHNGAWRWEIGEEAGSGYVALSGPTDTDHQWLEVLGPGESFTTVPAALALSADFTDAIGELTRYRRRIRREHADNHSMRVVFNDYMNTLNGDPTSEKLLPLVDAAGRVGAEVFCVDAGWYDDTGDWWDSVGEWLPSTTRFPGGFGRVIAHIHDVGMVPGLWLEPEVIGVRSPVADRLPDAAFLQRQGQRIVEHGRYHLDLRHPAARAQLDEAVDRLVSDFGIGYFKFDYNINPGAGSDLDCFGVGAALLGHNRAHLAWLDRLLDRHPGLILENCASGGMRADFAMLSRMQSQSTSDQQDLLRYAPIAAAAPLVMLPEQAANWAFPQPGMAAEEIAFTLATGLSGRFYLSGHLDRMDADELGLVGEAVAVAKRLRTLLPASVPRWPIGRPGWEDEWVALALDADDRLLLTVWARGASGPARLPFPALRGRPVRVQTLFPQRLPAWPVEWDPADAVLRIFPPNAGATGARLFQLDKTITG